MGEEINVREDIRMLAADLEGARKLKFRGKSYILFYSSYVKKRLHAGLARLEFYNNWFTFVMTIVGMFSNHPVTAGLGAASLFLGQLVVHFWYGYNRYPNPAMSCMAGDDEEYQQRLVEQTDAFKVTVERMSLIYRRGGEGKSDEQAGLEVIGFFLKAFNHIAVAAVVVGSFVALLTMYFGSAMKAGFEANNRNNTDAQRELCAIVFLILVSLAQVFVIFAFTISGVIGSVIGALAWAVLAFVADIQGGGWLILKVVASIMLLAYEEYYTAKLLGRSTKEFLQSLVLNAVFDNITEVEVFEALGQYNVGYQDPDMKSVEIDDGPTNKNEYEDGNATAESSSSETSVPPAAFEREDGNSAPF